MSNGTSTSATKLPVETFEVRFDGFEGLPARKTLDMVESQEFTCFGHQWSLGLYPGGHHFSSDGMVSVCLYYKSEDSVKVHATLIAPSDDNQASYTSLKEMEYVPDSLNHSMGTINFAKRSTIIDSLQDEALVIQVQMWQSKPIMPGYLDNQFGKIMLKNVMDEESADVIFEVISDDAMTDENMGTIFHAHHLILQDCAPYHYNLCASGDGSFAIPIADVKPKIFNHMLYYAY